MKPRIGLTVVWLGVAKPYFLKAKQHKHWLILSLILVPRTKVLVRPQINASSTNIAILLAE